MVNIDDGISVYFNAVKEGFLSMASATYKANPDVLSCSGVHIGAKNFLEQFELDGDLDEIKYFYRELFLQVTENNLKIAPNKNAFQ